MEQLDRLPTIWMLSIDAKSVLIFEKMPSGGRAGIET